MVSFRYKEISNPPGLGEQLRNCRDKSGISLAEAAEATNISSKYLAAIESGEFHELPGEIYAKNFLKVYTKFLGLDSDKFLSVFQSEQKIYAKTRRNTFDDFKKPVEKVSRLHLVTTPKIIKGLIIGILGVACLVYLGMKVKAIMAPPILTVSQPADNLITEQSLIEVRGQVEAEAILEINGQQVLADGEGNFSEVIDLQPGVNPIIIKAEKRHGKQSKIYRQVVVVDPSSLDEVNETNEQGGVNE